MRGGMVIRGMHGRMDISRRREECTGMVGRVLLRVRGKCPGRHM